MGQYERRFSGLERLYGEEGAERIKRAHVCVVGMGGVGSWAVEALARSGIGEITLIDLDDVCISNVNRQLHAVIGELGKPKVEVMERRVLAINPECRVHSIHGFFLKSNADEILQTPFTYVVDAIDSPSLKAVLISKCAERKVSVITTGGAGGRCDPTQVRVEDLALTSHDRLLAHVRRLLRRRHGFPRGDGAFGIECVVSREPASVPDGSCGAGVGGPDLRLDCNTGYGTAAFLTGVFGLVAASRVVNCIAGEATPSVPAEPKVRVKKCRVSTFRQRATGAVNADASPEALGI